MLKKIIMKNFKSYMEKAELDLNATGYEILNETNKDQNDILKGALIVGGNATGKSTVLHSIRLLLSLLVWQVNLRPIDYVCLFKERKGNMQLTYEFLINNENVSYLIEGDDKGIYKEKIYIDNVERLNRLKEYAEYTSPNGKKTSIENLQRNQSAIRKVYFDTKFVDDATLRKWFEFLEKSIYIDQPNKRIYKSAGNSSIITYRDYFDKNGTDKFNQFLKQIGNSQTVTYTNNYDNGRLKFNFENGQKDIIVERKNMSFALPITMESEGNQTLINTIPIVFETMRNGGMAVIDEFSSGFHNTLEEKIIKYFMENSKDAQLLLVSHSTNLLTNNLLRPDQIYTVDFIDGKGSVLNRVSDSKPREAQNLEKMYLSGVFNGLPNIK